MPSPRLSFHLDQLDTRILATPNTPNTPNTPKTNGHPPDFPLDHSQIGILTYMPDPYLRTVGIITNKYHLNLNMNLKNKSIVRPIS